MIKEIKKINEEMIIYLKEYNIKDELIKKTFFRILKELYDKNYFYRKGKSHYNIIFSANLYLTYQKIKQPISLKDISDITGSDYISIGREYKKIKKILGIKYCKISSIFSNKCIELIKLDKSIIKFGKELNYNNETIKIALKIDNKIKHYEDDKLSSCNPFIICGSILYIAGLINNEKRTQENISRKVNIKSLSIRRVYKIILKEIK